ncbi:two-component system response regulator BtsR [Wohlfahrtiimonas larvae]|uniref:Two-component system response regulator BtsR n=1 Tax=Wohlfahrtiimonas larvae TaxID=1157986 RepID=A0ABP9MSS1_9GAMM|nr:two-component system response regulator BtsR [Wohlfahrtiimonas larvae]
MFNVILIDDEPLARDNLRVLLAHYPNISIIGEAANAIEGIRLINQLKPDIIFVDIQMPRISGLEMISMLDPDQLPYIIFSTAYDEYAIQAFEASAFDYLLKPIETERLNKTILRLQSDNFHKAQPLHAITNPLNMIPCSGHSKIYLVNIIDIIYIGSDQTGVHVIKKDGSQYTSELTLRTIEERTSLIRCHRQYLIQLDALQEIQFNENGQAYAILYKNVVVPISRRYLKMIKERIGLINS